MISETPRRSLRKNTTKRSTIRANATGTPTAHAGVGGRRPGRVRPDRAPFGRVLPQGAPRRLADHCPGRAGGPVGGLRAVGAAVSADLFLDGRARADARDRPLLRR